jgi:hypothetical protein
MDIIIKDIIVLGVTQKAYTLDSGKSGFSFKADVIINGAVATFKTTEEVFKDVGSQKMINCATSVFKLEAYKMEPRLVLSSVTY